MVSIRACALKVGRVVGLVVAVAVFVGSAAVAAAEPAGQDSAEAVAKKLFASLKDQNWRRVYECFADTADQDRILGLIQAAVAHRDDFAKAQIGTVTADPADAGAATATVSNGETKTIQIRLVRVGTTWFVHEELLAHVGSGREYIEKAEAARKQPAETGTRPPAKPETERAPMTEELLAKAYDEYLDFVIEAALKGESFDATKVMDDTAKARGYKSWMELAQTAAVTLGAEKFQKVTQERTEAFQERLKQRLAGK